MGKFRFEEFYFAPLPFGGILFTRGLSRGYNVSSHSHSPFYHELGLVEKQQEVLQVDIG